jgi:integrase
VSPAGEHWYAGSLQLEAEALGSRRGHGEGSIFQRADDGKWLAVLEIGRDPATGKRVRRTITAATRREAAQRLRALRDQLDRGAINVDGRATIGQWSERWLEHVRYRRDVTGDLRPNTAASYERLTRVHVVGRIGAVRLAQLTPGHVERVCQAMLADGLAPSSVAKVVQVLSLMLELAVREGAVVANPVARAQLPRQSRSPVAVLSPGQVDGILAYAAGTTDAALWGSMALAGLRLGEALGLADHDVDLDTGLVHIRRTLLQDRSFGPPKSERGIRDVPVTHRLEQLVRSHRKLVAARRLAAATWVETDALFPTQRGTYPSIRNVQRRFRGVVRALELPTGTSPHTLRHTWASVLLSSGVPIFLVSRYAGHATIQTTADQYGHLVPGDEQAADLIRTTLNRAFRAGA